MPSSTITTGPAQTDGLGVDAIEREFWAIVAAEEDLLCAEVDELVASLTPLVPASPRRAGRPGHGSRRLGAPRYASGSAPVLGLPPERPIVDQRSPPRT